MAAGGTAGPLAHGLALGMASLLDPLLGTPRTASDAQSELQQPPRDGDRAPPDAAAAARHAVGLVGAEHHGAHARGALRGDHGAPGVAPPGVLFVRQLRVQLAGGAHHAAVRGRAVRAVGRARPQRRAAPPRRARGCVVLFQRARRGRRAEHYDHLGGCDDNLDAPDDSCRGCGTIQRWGEDQRALGCRGRLGGRLPRGFGLG